MPELSQQHVCWNCCDWESYCKTRGNPVLLVNLKSSEITLTLSSVIKNTVVAFNADSAVKQVNLYSALTVVLQLNLFLCKVSLLNTFISFHSALEVVSFGFKQWDCCLPTQRLNTVLTFKPSTSSVCPLQPSLAIGWKLIMCTVIFSYFYSCARWSILYVKVMTVFSGSTCE